MRERIYPRCACHVLSCPIQGTDRVSSPGKQASHQPTNPLLAGLLNFDLVVVFS